MIKLVTSNPKKYVDFQKELNFLQIDLTVINDNLPEIQTESIEENIKYKAIQAEKMYKEPVFVDDSALFTEQYKLFPGVNTRLILKQLGKNGLEKLFRDGSKKAKITTVIGISINKNIFTYTGEVNGYLDFTRKVNNPKMLLSDIFIPFNKEENIFHHRLNALNNLKEDISNLFKLIKESTNE